jgi:hypothetical protein
MVRAVFISSKHPPSPDHLLFCMHLLASAIQIHHPSSLPPSSFHTEGRVFADYQGLEEPRDDVDTISNATYLNNFKDFISKAEPQWDTDKKNQLFYQ